jgi:hypothetical protein
MEWSLQGAKYVLLARGSLGLDDLFDDLRLLNQECPQNSNKHMFKILIVASIAIHVPGLDTVTASRATIRALNGLLALGDRCVLARSQCRHLKIQRSVNSI